MRLLCALLVATSEAGCGKTGEATPESLQLNRVPGLEAPKPNPDPATAPEQALGSFRNTWYFLALEDDFPRQSLDFSVLDMQGNELIRLGKSFFDALKLEGSAKLTDGRVLNFAGRVNGESRFKWTDAPFGLGVKNCRLTPLRSIAVDPKRIPYGTTVRIEETVGLRFPDGRIHDGIWVAEDTGSAIVDDRIDLFMGAGKSNGNALYRLGITHLKPLTLIQVSPPSADHCSQSR